MADYTYNNSFNNDNNQNNKRIGGSYFSRFKANNYNTNMELNIRFSSGMLTIGIRDKDKAFEAGSMTNNLIEVTLTGLKAMILMQKIGEFEEKITTGSISPKEAFGVQTGLGEISTVIGFHITDDGTSKALTIAKINPQGEIVDSHTYIFQLENYYGINWKDFSKMKFDKVYTNDIEYEALKNALSNFAKHYAGSAVYPALDMFRYDYRSLQSRIDTVAEKLGVPMRNPNYNNTRANNFFNSMNPPESGKENSNHINYDQMGDLLDIDS